MFRRTGTEGARGSGLARGPAPRPARRRIHGAHGAPYEMISLVVAMAENRVIGRDNALPWRLSPDLKRFRRVTMGHPIVMGRKTYQSIGRALDGRRNIVITRNPGFRAEGVTVVGSIEEALSSANDEEIMIIGGADIYAQTLPRARRIHLTLIHENFDGDAFFPELSSGEWKETAREDVAPGVDAGFGYSFITLERVMRDAWKVDGRW